MRSGSFFQGIRRLFGLRTSSSLRNRSGARVRYRSAESSPASPIYADSAGSIRFRSLRPFIQELIRCTAKVGRRSCNRVWLSICREAKPSDLCRSLRKHLPRVHWPIALSVFVTRKLSHVIRFRALNAAYDLTNLTRSGQRGIVRREHEPIRPAVTRPFFRWTSSSLSDTSSPTLIPVP